LCHGLFVLINFHKFPNQNFWWEKNHESFQRILSLQLCNEKYWISNLFPSSGAEWYKLKRSRVSVQVINNSGCNEEWERKKGKGSSNKKEEYCGQRMLDVKSCVIILVILLEWWVGVTDKRNELSFEFENSLLLSSEKSIKVLGMDHHF